MNKEEIKKAADELVMEHFKLVEPIFIDFSKQDVDNAMDACNSKAILHSIITVKKQIEVLEPTLQSISIKLQGDLNDYESPKLLELKAILKELEDRL